MKPTCARAGGLPGLGLEAAIERRRTLHEAREILRAAQLPDQTGGMPGGAMGQAAALEQQHVSRALAGKMVGDSAANHAAANDDDRRLRGHPIAHVAIAARNSPRYQPMNCATLRSFSTANGPGRYRVEATPACTASQIAQSCSEVRCQNGSNRARS